MLSNIIEELKWRNIVKDISNLEKIITAQNEHKGIYCGFDPSNDSLHLGNLMQIILLRRFALYGFQPIALVGGGTAMIGDPSGKSQERKLLATEELENNVKAISKQLSSLVNYQKIGNIAILDLIDNFNLLSIKDLHMLDMIVKSINLNNSYHETLREIIKKLPLPLQELNLSYAEMTSLYQILQIDTNYLKQYQALASLDFKALLNYLEHWKDIWNQFLQIIWGYDNSRSVRNIKILNNKNWLGNFNMLDFLRDVGKNFNINQMLNKETVATRLDVGISYTEFSYQVLQAYDFYHLYQNENCYLQSGGSDQWGNITAGLDLIRKKTSDQHHAAGITINLLTKANGQKFGKTEQGAIFLAPEKTSTYELYQFLVNQEDKDVLKLLTSLTFLNDNQIKFIISLHEKNPKKRLGQKTLAALITIFVAKLGGFFQAIKVTDALFHDEIKKLKVTEILKIFKDVPSIKQEKEELLIDVLVNNKICHSKREVRELLAAQAIRINGEKVTDENWVIKKENAINKQVSLIKKGKKHYFLVLHQY